jgi:hypothetical protein
MTTSLRLPSSSAGFLLGLLIDHEDGDSVFHRNVGRFPNYPEQPRGPYSS